MKNYGIVSVVALTAIILVVVAAIVWVTEFGSPSRSTPALSSLLGLLAILVPVLVGLVKVERIAQDVHRQNGTLEEHAKQIQDLTTPNPSVEVTDKPTQ